MALVLERDLDFHLPKELLATEPKERGQDRLLVLDPDREDMQDRGFGELGSFLREGDLLVFNDTRVMKARLYGRTRAEKIHEALLLEPLANAYEWKALVRDARRMSVGEVLEFGKGLTARVGEGAPDGSRTLRFNCAIDGEALESQGEMPIPPYIVRKRQRQKLNTYYAEDDQWYQSIFARHFGSVAAPTASLHFTEEMMQTLHARGIESAFVTLHVGWGTFQPIQGKVSDFRMHSERARVSVSTRNQILAAQARGSRVVAVGTTVVRTLEYGAQLGQLEAYDDAVDLVIQPPYPFRVVDALLTNFHMPRSSLLLLVYAFAGVDFMKRAYAHAIAEGYRFYSYGDSMLVMRSDRAQEERC